MNKKVPNFYKSVVISPKAHTFFYGTALDTGFAVRKPLKPFFCSKYGIRLFGRRASMLSGKYIKSMNMCMSWAILGIVPCFTIHVNYLNIYCV